MISMLVSTIMASPISPHFRLSFFPVSATEALKRSLALERGNAEKLQQDPGNPYDRLSSHA